MSGVKDERLHKEGGGVCYSSQSMSPCLKSWSAEGKNFTAHVKFVKTNGPATYRNVLGEAAGSVGQTLVSFHSNHNHLQ